jgi:hypothetical protein
MRQQENGMTDLVEPSEPPLAQPPRRWSKLAIACFIIGIISGPLAAAIAYLLVIAPGGSMAVEASSASCQGILLFPSVLALGLGISALLRNRRKGLRGIRLAVAGMIISLLWIATIYIFLLMAVLEAVRKVGLS